MLSTQSKKILRSLFLLGGLAFFVMTPAAQAQTYKDTIHVPVTFYDFHSDGSNPEFEINPGSAAGRHTGMVASRLNAQRKPILGTTPFYNCQIAKWFVPWTSGDFTIPNYTSPVTSVCGNPPSTVTYDTAFKNIVIDTFLVFNLVPGSAGVYSYNAPLFFPLDGKGFGAEVAQGQLRTHNYSFSMELHWQFKKVPGMSFIFTGDDDVWAFIDSTLQMDIGGIHNPVTDSVLLDKIPGLVNGKSYTLDFFSCERHVTGSDIRITTNIITAPPVGIQLTSHPNLDTIAAGDSIFYTGEVIDDTGAIRTDYSKQIQWALLPQGTQSSITGSLGENDTFIARTAYTSYLITTTFTDPQNPSKVFHTSDTVYVIAGPPTRVVIEADSIISNPRIPSKLTSVTMDSLTNTIRVYAVLYDKFGNFAGLANSAAWSSKDPGVVTIAPKPGKNSEGVIQRQTRNLDTTSIIATQGALIPDTLRVIVKQQETEIKSVCIVPGTSGDSLSIVFNGAVNWSTSSIGSNTLYRKSSNGTMTLFSSLTTNTPAHLSDEIIYVLPSGALVAYSDSVTLRLPVAPNARVFALHYCHEIPFIKDVRIGPNPVIPGETTIPDNLRSAGDPKIGVRLEIILATRSTGSPTKPGTSGRVTIFDAVGNVVFGPSQMKFDLKDNNGDKLYYIWDFRNTKGSQVAGGTYLAKFEAQDSNTGYNGTKQGRIGIKTKK